MAIPEIADYEVRRGLILAGSTEGIGRLDGLREELGFYIPISTEAMSDSLAETTRRHLTRVAAQAQRDSRTPALVAGVARRGRRHRRPRG